MDVAPRIAALKGAALGLVRRGPRTVLWTPGALGFGNHLYLWFWAHRQRSAGRPAAVLWRPEMEPWLALFPALGDLVVRRSQVHPTDRRQPDEWGMGYGRDFNTAELEEFCRQRLLSAPVLDAAGAPFADPDALVINVRRGDYYSNPTFRGMYSFDVEAYLRLAVGQAAAERPIGRLHVVSDGSDWCRARLGWLAEHADELSFSSPADGPAQNLREVATAQRLVLTNSTFSYWAGYLATTAHGRPDQVWAPWFHARIFDGGRAFQLDPRWRIVRDIPGGWDS